jgi:hypothetical protein
MSKVPTLIVAMIVSGAAALMSGCVSYGGNTHALITPVGIAGYHTFKPENAPQPVRQPDRMASTNAQRQQQAELQDEI